jgi:hypothetical protein
VKCSKGVFGAGQACQAMGNLYHDACFTCAACSKCGALGGRGKGHAVREGGDGEDHGMEARAPCMLGNVLESRNS